ncbi:MAG: peroxiredoxin family protein [Gammaproteobacteria bacterium]
MLLPSVVAAAGPALDEPAPDFALHSSTGHNLRLSEYRGDVVLLNFWTQACGRCREQLDRIEDLWQAHRGEGFTVLSVAIVDDPRDARDLADAMRLSYPVLFDNERVAARLYDPESMPLTLLIDPHGRVRHVHRRYRSGDERKYSEQLAALLAESRQSPEADFF